MIPSSHLLLGEYYSNIVYEISSLIYNQKIVSSKIIVQHT